MRPRAGPGRKTAESSCTGADPLGPGHRQQGARNGMIGGSLSAPASPSDDPAPTLAGDVVAGYAGVALRLHGDGSLAGANERGHGLAALMARGLVPGITNLVQRARTQGGAVTDTVEISTGPGAQVLMVTVLPLADGGQMVLGHDATLERNLRTALVESRQRYKDLVEASNDFAWEVGTDGAFTFVSPRGALGFAASDLVGQAPQDLLLDPELENQPNPFLAHRPMDEVEVWVRRADGEPACILTTAIPLSDAAGQWRGTRGVARDVTNDRERDAALNRSQHREQLLTYIVRTVRNEVDPRDMLRAAAVSVSSAMGADVCQIFHRDDKHRFREAATYGTLAESVPVWSVVDGLSFGGDSLEMTFGDWRVLANTSIYRHQTNGALLLWRTAGRLTWTDEERTLVSDVANQIGIILEQIHNHERILHLTRTDPLTELLNRRAFLQEVTRRHRRLSHDNQSAALMYVDLDNFKLVNDTHGHQRGDEALLALRDLLVRHTRPTDLVARLGGDEFGVWLERISKEDATRKAERLLEMVAPLDAYSGAPDRPLTVSIGLAYHDPERPHPLKTLMARADQALHDAKHHGHAALRIARPAETWEVEEPQ